jgi:hypothetical protein
MRIVLINPPNGLLDPTDLAPPLGLLTLAAVVRQSGYEVSIIDFNLEVMANPEMDGNRFYEVAVASVMSLQPDVVALTSMCMESHVSLELARGVKAQSPKMVTILGGTHFGAIASEVLEYFPFIDFVVSGEGEVALVAILDHLKNQNQPLPKNVLHRESAKIISGSEEPYRPKLEDLPFPAYDLIDISRYFALNPRCVVDYDSGRGCIFKCSFCYSPFQYGDDVRNKQPEHILRDLHRLAELGAKHVFFVQDNLLNSPRWAIDLCKHIAEAELPLTWSCYVTYPQLTKEIIDWLATAGCIGVFTGIDAVSQDSQVRMNKRFLKSWQSVRDKLAYCLERNVVPTCAFILEGPHQSTAEKEGIIRTAIECLGIGCDSHINTLSIYNGSKLDDQWLTTIPRYSPAKTELLMDAPLVVQNNDFAKRWPGLFPYHSAFGDAKDWEVFIAKVHTIFALLYAFPTTLNQYVLEEENCLWDSLIYIDNEFVGRLQQTPQQERRFAALQEFCSHFTSLSLSAASRRGFQRESARLRLSRHQEARTLKLLIEGNLELFVLAWFIDISEPQEYSCASEATVIQSGIKSETAPIDRVSDHLQNRDECALLSTSHTVKIISVPRHLRILLRRCEEAVSSDAPVELDQESLQLLEQEGWVWRQFDWRKTAQSDKLVRL